MSELVDVPRPGALKVVIAVISRGSNNDTHGLTSGTIAFPERKVGIAESSENPRGISPGRWRSVVFFSLSRVAPLYGCLSIHPARTVVFIRTALRVALHGARPCRLRRYRSVRGRMQRLSRAESALLQFG